MRVMDKLFRRKKHERGKSCLDIEDIDKDLQFEREPYSPVKVDESERYAQKKQAIRKGIEKTVTSYGMKDSYYDDI